jgi:uncharacterized membrane protein YheB (UPF0754 family)
MLDVVVPLILGAAIGYVTNWLAIKMLFWPREKKYVLGYHVPLTPGLFVRRRHVFSGSVAKLVETRFTNADDMYAMVQRAEEEGVMDKFLESMGPAFKLVFMSYIKRTSFEDFKKDCRKLAVTMRRGRLVSKTVKQKIDDMPTLEIENMVLGVVQRELRVITWLGAVLGAAIGALQLLL